MENQKMLQRDLLRRKLKQTATVRQTSSASTPIPRADRSQPLLMSRGQQRLWLLHQLEDVGAAYNMHATLRLRGVLHCAALRRSLDELLSRHEVLRTAYARGDGSPVIASEALFTLVTVDLSDRDARQREAELQRQLMQELQQPFDLTVAPLIRGRLLRLGAQEHVLILTLHHIAADGWSMGILLRELAILYKAFVEERVSPLPAPSLQYADYAMWQRGWLQGEALDRQLAYWKQQLADAPVLLELPTDKPRPRIKNYSGASIEFALTPQLTHRLNALARCHEATLLMVVCTGFAILLHRLSGQDDVVIGMPVANRQRSEVEGMMGFFVDTLPLRVRLQDDPSVSSLLDRVKALALDAYSHQDVPFEDIVQALQPPRSLGHSPIFQTMLYLQSGARPQLQLPGIAAAFQKMPAATEKFDLSLSLQEAAERLEGNFSFASDLFEPATIERWIGYFRAILAAMVEDAEQCVSSMELLGDEERAQLLHAFNATRSPYPGDKLIHELFEEQVARNPQAIALVSGDRELSYEQLDAEAEELACRLRNRGIGVGHRIGIGMEHGLEMVVALLGVLKAGGAYVPLDPAYPPERLAYMLADCAPSMIITSRQLKSRFVAASAAVLAIDEPWEEIAAGSASRRELIDVCDPTKRPAYVIYTSGSTGQPKGVVVSHGSVVNFLVSMQREPGISERDCLLAVTTLSFDIAGLEIFLPLISGARTILVGPEIAADAAQLIRVIDTKAVTLMQATPATWQLLLRGGWRGKADLKALCGGEALTADLADQIKSRVRVLWNMYGPTETTIWSCTRNVNATPGNRQPLESIGRPIANTRIYILDRHQRPVPIGVAGEIHIGGVGVALGYLNRPELTSARFLTDPFDTAASARMYRTGDLGRFCADGNIEYLGRNDDQVKIRGFRIELGEIEAQLRRHPAIDVAVVIAREDAAGEKRLVAYVSKREGMTPNVEELRAQLKTSLPPYMVPSAYVILDALPLTPNGKIDRKRLPSESATYASRPYEAPQDEIETILADMWRELLRVERVGRHDNFFDLGGHSLIVVRLIGRIRQVWGRELQMRELFEHPTVRTLAVRVRNAPACVLMPIERVDRQQALPLSWAQERLWIIDQIEGGGTNYHMPGAVRLRGMLDRSALRRALDTIITRHEVLRTVFAKAEEVAVQRICTETNFALRVVDLSRHDADTRESAVRRELADETTAAFDLSAGPLIRGRLLCLSPQEHVLAITMHHIAADGWSIEILFKEMAELYAAFHADRPDPLPPLPVQYADYAVWQRGSSPAELQHQLDYWMQQLAGIPVLLELPIDRPRPLVKISPGASIYFAFDSTLCERLKVLARRHDVTLFMVLYAGFAVLLSRLSGQQDVVIGTPMANRQRTELEGLIGLFINTLALRLQIDAGSSVATLLDQARATMLAAHSHQDIPFEKVVEALRPPRSLAHHPVFQVMLTLQDMAWAQTVTLPGLTLAAEPAPQSGEKFDLSLSLHETGGRIAGHLSYATDLFDRATIERWIGHFECVLESMAHDSTRQVDSIELLREPELHQLVRGFNDTQAPYPRESLIHELFEEQAERSPQRVAVIDGGRRLTYAELNRHANRFARHLLGHGVAAGQYVPILIGRCVEMLVAQLAVFKLGCAYVPIDPGLPQERQMFMIKDCGATTLIGSGEPAIAWDVSGIRWIDGVQVMEASAGDESSPLPRVADKSVAAYVMYTSGSTGVPKGVAVSHQSLYRLVLDSEYARVGPDDCVAHCSNPAFDAAPFEIWLALLNGASLLIVPQPVLLDPPRLTSLLADHSVSVLLLTTGLFNQYADMLTEAFARLRYLIMGGDVLDPAAVRRVFERGRPLHLLNVYGPTETTTMATIFQVEPVAEDGRPIPIGRPVANTQVYILDSRQRPVPIGVAGEIHIGGTGVAQGYVNQPHLTAERFIFDPFADRPGARMYRTGDLGRWRADGNVEFLGRNDLQVKIRGFRIELGEIEATLGAHPFVQSCAVLARHDHGGEKTLVAYVVASAVALDDPSAEVRAVLQEHLQQLLPDYMVPRSFVLLERLPLNANGKVDRRALPAPDIDAFAQASYVAPATPAEQAMVEVWAEMLRFAPDKVSTTANFFALGGHSILATRLVNRINQRFGSQITLRTVFEKPSLAQLAAAIADASTAQRVDPAAQLQKILEKIRIVKGPQRDTSTLQEGHRE